MYTNSSVLRYTNSMKPNDDATMDEAITLETKKALVMKQACFKKLYDNEAAELAELFIIQTVAAGETIVNKGDIVESVFLIIDGKADVRDKTFINNEAKWQSIATLGPGESIGLSETGLYSLSGKRTATVVALTDMTLLRLSVALLNGAALANSHIAEVMNRFQRG